LEQLDQRLAVAKTVSSGDGGDPYGGDSHHTLQHAVSETYDQECDTHERSGADKGKALCGLDRSCESSNAYVRSCDARDWDVGHGHTVECRKGLRKQRHGSVRFSSKIVTLSHTKPSTLAGQGSKLRCSHKELLPQVIFVIFFNHMLCCISGPNALTPTHTPAPHPRRKKTPRLRTRRESKRQPRIRSASKRRCT
jgi:hypothetical protein